jgi:hypothetical protein
VYVCGTLDFRFSAAVIPPTAAAAAAAATVLLVLVLVLLPIDSSMPQGLLSAAMVS